MPNEGRHTELTREQERSVQRLGADVRRDLAHEGIDIAGIQFDIALILHDKASDVDQFASRLLASDIYAPELAESEAGDHEGAKREFSALVNGTLSLDEFSPPEFRAEPGQAFHYRLGQLVQGTKKPIAYVDNAPYPREGARTANDLMLGLFKKRAPYAQARAQFNRRTDRIRRWIVGERNTAILKELRPVLVALIKAHPELHKSRHPKPILVFIAIGRSHDGVAKALTLSDCPTTVTTDMRPSPNRNGEDVLNENLQTARNRMFNNALQAFFKPSHPTALRKYINAHPEAVYMRLMQIFELNDEVERQAALTEYLSEIVPM